MASINGISNEIFRYLAPVIILILNNYHYRCITFQQSLTTGVLPGSMENCYCYNYVDIKRQEKQGTINNLCSTISKVL